MKTLKNINLKGKKVILRCDFNVPVSNGGDIIDDSRIKRTLPTIEFLIANEAKIIIIGHLGRPWNDSRFPRRNALKKEYSLKPICDYLSGAINRPIKFLEDCLDEKNVQETELMKEKEIIMFENIRFYIEEKENNIAFAEKISKLGDIFVNESFSASHREHASIVSLPKYLPSCAGFLFEEELNNLSEAIKSPKRPLVVIIGGVKLETKMPIIINFLDKADHILIGGQIANSILAAKGIAIGKFILNSKFEENIDKIKLTDPKIHLPVDGVVSLSVIDEDYMRVTAVGKVRREEECFDIGPETINLFSDIIKTANTIIWNGPLGFYEHKKFEKGSLAIAEAILKSNAFSLVGGGETLAMLNKHGIRDKFNYVSTGGGAMLDFLSGKKLPGVVALE